jgi:hypothetical protein
MRIIPESWLPSCAMRGIVNHWTGGAYRASAVDKRHYHIIIEGDGTLVRGNHSIANNVNCANGNYAAHTRGCNTGFIGVSLAAMAGATESPLNFGRFPVTREQYEALVRVNADLCERYGIGVSAQTVLGHCEVERYLGKPQRGKWDPWRFAWSPESDRYTLGGQFRQDVSRALRATSYPHLLTEVGVRVGDQVVSLSGYLDGGTAWVPVRPVVEALSGTVVGLKSGLFTVRRGEKLFELPAAVRGTTGYTPARALRDLGVSVEWDASTRTVTFRP